MIIGMVCPYCHTPLQAWEAGVVRSPTGFIYADLQYVCARGHVFTTPPANEGQGSLPWGAPWIRL